FLLAMVFASMMNTNTFASSFTDISNVQGREYIEKFAEKGYIKGYEDNTFRPNNTITRAEISQVLANFNINLKFEDISFTDNKGWFTNAVKKATQNGFLSGYKDGTFKPNNKITRFEMIKIVSMLVRSSNYDKVQLPYSDSGKIPSWVLNDVNNLYASKVIDFYDNNTIDGNVYITRAEAVTMLSKALEVNNWDMNKVTQNVKTNKINPLPTPTALPSGVIGYLTVSGTNIKDFPVKDGLGNTELLAVMKTAIGHFAETPIWNGNIGLSAHNRDYKIDFRQLKNVKIGDKITYRTNFGTRTYKITIKTEISETDWSYLEDTTDNRITLITCIEDKPTKRLLVQAIQI
ncbi:MAG: sortase, partial [Eubacteriales bacterium]|nr:sortase [Eubacteriales bacterium]